MCWNVYSEKFSLEGGKTMKFFKKMDSLEKWIMVAIIFNLIALVCQTARLVYILCQ